MLSNVAPTTPQDDIKVEGLRRSQREGKYKLDIKKLFHIKPQRASVSTTTVSAQKKTTTSSTASTVMKKPTTPKKKPHRRQQQQKYAKAATTKSKKKTTKKLTPPPKKTSTVIIMAKILKKMANWLFQIDHNWPLLIYRSIDREQP